MTAWDIVGSAADLLPAAPLGIDVTICDPPYAPRVHDRAASVSAAVRDGVLHRDLTFAALSDDLRSEISQIVVATRTWAIVYSDIETAHEWIALAGKNYMRSIPWVRWSQPQLSGDRPPSGCELLVCSNRSVPRHWNGPGNLTHLDHSSLRGSNKHPTEKPLGQALDLVSWFSEPGDLICDPTCGSGVIGCAAILLGRHFIGAEVQENWRDFARERIENAARGHLSHRDRVQADAWRESERLADPGTDPARARLAARDRDRARLA